MSNPLIQQGSLNRLLGGIIIPGLPYLSVSSPFLGKEGVSITLDGEASQLHGTMTGGVPSPEPWQFATITAHILKTNGLGAAYKNQFETDTNIGNVSVFTDTVALPPYDFDTAVLQNQSGIDLSGTKPDFVVTIKCIYRINSALFLGA